MIKSYSGNLRELIDEADAVKRDLETLMDGAVNLSRQIIEDLDGKIQVAATNQAQQVEVKDNYQEAAEKQEQDKQVAAAYLAQIDAEKSSPMVQEQEPDYFVMHPYIAVKTLYNNGLTVTEIAKTLGRGQGEVKLILNLCTKKKAI
ncbi:MAG: hypothetical protein PHT79_00600 [Syntrophomonadaceae bacterium]|nr:hypothetical protein [Syntrophomonadaceae bacterium]MDD3888631.1 hypothetical protein [Syntrophomonadaceae bacterium]MDD4548254.1 hypothetical protein [Syntrophomonadaceae bacterium]